MQATLAKVQKLIIVGKTKLSAVTVYFPPEDKEKLSAWARRENRSLSNLVAHLAIKALKPHESFQDEEESLANGQART